MSKNKSSLYASYVVMACGLLIVLLQFFSGFQINFKTFFGMVFIVLGYMGIRFFKNKV